MITSGVALTSFTGADGVRWVRAKVACAKCVKEERDCWVASNRRARDCEGCTRTHVSCSGATGWGPDEEWPTGPTITIKRKAIEEPGDGGSHKRRRGEEVESPGERAMLEAAQELRMNTQAAWILIRELRGQQAQRESKAVQTVVDLSEEVEVVKEKKKEKEVKKERVEEDEGESEQGEREDEGEESRAAALALFDHISSDIEQ